MANNVSQFFFAWVGSGETSFNSSHMREDELIFSFKLTHEEGQFATLDIEIINPRVGILAPGRPIWAWFSWSDGTSVYPLFHGRVVGIPSNLFEEVITLSLVAKPIDYVAQRAALAESLKVLPYYDPIFIDATKQSDPDVVLEAYSRLWHVDRVTGQVTTSDLIIGEDGLDEFTPSDVFYENVSLEIGQSPLVEVEMSATTEWKQTGGGTLNFGRKAITSWTGGIVSDWPQPGSDLQGGYRATDNTFAYDAVPTGEAMPYNYSWKNQEDTHLNGDALSLTASITGRGAVVHSEWHTQTGNPDSGQQAELSVSETLFDIKIYSVFAGLELAMNMEQGRKETVKFSVTADLQPILTEPDEESIKETISFTASDVVAAGVLGSSAGSYFTTPRGLQSLEYMLLVARAHLLAKARVVKVGWDCRFSRIVSMSCRKNASVEDERLPGGITMGKVVSYEMTGAGDSGTFIGHVTINSAIGYGNAITVVDGTPDYVAVGYVDPGYQHYSGTLQPVPTGDIVYTIPAYPGTGLQNPLTMGQVVVRGPIWDTHFNDAAGYAAYTAAWAEAGKQANQTIDTAKIDVSGTMPSEFRTIQQQRELHKNDVENSLPDGPVFFEVELKPLTGVDVDTEIDIQLQPLVVPMQVNLSVT